MHDVPQLSERESQILHAIVHSYILTAEPVGSRSVVKRFGLDLSPATVRNVMADLEEMGFLQQLHTSSGRVPTPSGYRYYVNRLMRVQELTLAERDRIEQELTERLQDADAVLRQTSHLLALTTHQAGMAEVPGDGNAQVHRIELMTVSDQRLAVLIVDNFGRVRSMMVQVETTFPRDELVRMNNFLNEHLNGVALEQLTSAMSGKLKHYLDEQRRLAERALSVLNLLPAHRPQQLYLEGAAHLFEQPEFKDIDRAREVFGLIEERDRLLDLLRQAAVEADHARGMVFIGGEDSARGFEGISVIASPYRVGGESVGMVGILGPRRMPYSRLTSIVDYTAEMVGRILTRLGS